MYPAGESRREVLTAGGRPAIFSFKEEAESFLAAAGARGTGDLPGAPTGGWRVEEFWAAELSCMLSGPLSGFVRLVLDPLPETACQAVNGLVSVGREEFLSRLSQRSHSPSPLSTEG